VQYSFTLGLYLTIVRSTVFFNVNVASKYCGSEVPSFFCENLKPLGGGWDSIFLIVDNIVFSSLSL